MKTSTNFWMRSITPEAKIPTPNDKVLLDTDVYSYLMKAGDKRGDPYRRHVEGSLVAVSFVTVGELLFGAIRKKWGQDRLEDLKQRLRTVVIVPYDYEICTTYARLKANLESHGKSVTANDNDLWIAACAVRHSIPLVSNNRRHFQAISELLLISEAPLIGEVEVIQGKITFEPKGNTATEVQRPSEQSPSPSDQKHS